MPFTVKSAPAEILQGLEIISKRFCLKREISLTAGHAPNLCVELKGDALYIGFSKKAEFFRGLALACGGTKVKDAAFEKNKVFDSAGVMVDCSRNAVPTVQSVKELIELLAICGLDNLQLYTEVTYEIEGEPYFGYFKGRYTQSELKEIEAYGDIFGIEVIPCIQTLAHLESLQKTLQYRSRFDIDNILLAGETKTYELIEKMFSVMRKCFKTEKINIGMDEAHHLGRGVYHDKNGCRPRSEIMSEHLFEVLKIADKYGFRPMMWSDMFFQSSLLGIIGDDAFKNVPENVDLVYWQYYCNHTDEYNAKMKRHLQLKNKVYFANAAYTWTGFTPHNRDAIDAMDVSYDCAINNGIKDVLLTVWGDGGGECSVFNALPTLAFAGEKAYGGNYQTLIENFPRVSGCRLEDFLTLDLPDYAADNITLRTKNPAKYMLFSDCFLGFFDTRARENAAPVFVRNEKLIKAAGKCCKGFKENFDVSAALCGAMSVKYDLGVRTRAAYLNNDRETLSVLCEKTYPAAAKKIEKLYSAVIKLWDKYNKPNGFEVQDIRFGGLIKRIMHCGKRLKLYIDGVLKNIPELEEAPLDFLGESYNHDMPEIEWNGWQTFFPSTL